DSMGQRGCVVGPFRDALGAKRDVVRPARVPVLFFHESRREGLVAHLHVEALALGRGHAYADVDSLGLVPTDAAFRRAMTAAWRAGVAHAGEERVSKLDLDGRGPVDLRWRLELPGCLEPVPLRGGSLSAALATAMASVLLRQRVPHWWAITASVLKGGVDAPS